MKALFKDEGFKPHGGIQIWEAPEVVALIGYTSAYDHLYFDVGFCLSALSKDISHRVEKSHIYGRLERLFPQLRPEIIDAGDCSNSEYFKTFIDTFRDHLHKTIAPGLKILASESGLTEKYLKGELGHFLILPAARNQLTSRIS